MIRSGAAVILVAGREYVTDDAQYDGRAVTFTGRLHICNRSGDRLYAPRTFTLPIDRVEIEWVSR